MALQRSKEAYFQRGGELAKLRKEGSASNRDLERADTKFRKAGEEYRNLVEKYTQLRQDFERKMTVSCRVKRLVAIELITKCCNNGLYWVIFYSISRKWKRVI